MGDPLLVHSARYGEVCGVVLGVILGGSLSTELVQQPCNLQCFVILVGRSCHPNPVFYSVLLKTAPEQWSEIAAKSVERGTIKCTPLCRGERNLWCILWRYFSGAKWTTE